MVAPSGPLERARITPSIEILRKRYRVHFNEAAFAREGYLAGTDQRRADEFNAALRDPSVRAIFIARGGYGAMRILDSLDSDALRRDPIPIVGFSDATAILGWSVVAAEVRGIHGPLLRQLATIPKTDLAWLFALLETPHPDKAALSDLVFPSSRCSSGGGSHPVEGQLWGGNLCMVANLVGTPFWPKHPRDAIVFLEEVGERPYAIDRYLTSLFARGAFESARLALIGQLTRCADSSIGDNIGDHGVAEQVVLERLTTQGIKTAFSQSFGHGAVNRALPFLGRVRIDGEVMRLLDGAVS